MLEREEDLIYFVGIGQGAKRARAWKLLSKRSVELGATSGRENVGGVVRSDAARGENLDFSCRLQLAEYINTLFRMLWTAAGQNAMESEFSKPRCRTDWVLNLIECSVHD